MKTPILYLILPSLLQTASSSCFDQTNCRDCLNSSCDWSEAGCLDSCSMIADVSCYSFDYFLNATTEEVCTIADTNKADANLCSSKTDCSSCVGTVLSDGETTCMWFDDGFCGSACGMIGCGETTCPSTISGFGETVMKTLDTVEESATGITSSASNIVNQIVNEVLGTEAPTLSPTIYIAPETQVDKVVGKVTTTITTITTTVKEVSGNVLTP